MFRQRVLNHFHRAGWVVEDAPDLAGFRPDFVVERRTARKAVMVRDEPPGPVALGTFAHECRKRGLRPILVAPEDAVLLESCENLGVELLPAESIGEVPVVGIAPEPPPLPLETPRPVARPAPVPPQPVAAIPWWRWGIVALIWAAALALVAYDLTKIL